MFQIRGGVSLAGGEFGSERTTFSNRAPGIYDYAYKYPGEQTIAYFVNQGLGLLRVPFRWERLQPEPGQPLDPAELGRLRQLVQCVAAYGGVVILDLHNYGRYRLEWFSKPRAFVIDERVGGIVAVSRQQFADFWRRVAAEFAGNRTVIGCGLMNEPHDMGASDWKLISQTAVDALRTVNGDVHVLVSGDEWSRAGHFEEVNGPTAWIHDAAQRTVYEAHCYFDADSSGRYRRSHAAELAADPELNLRGQRRLEVFLGWCRRNDVMGFVGAFGIPGADAGWQAVLKPALESLNASNFPACYWAAGDWWNNYPLSVQPSDDFRQPAPQLSLLKQYLATSR